MFNLIRRYLIVVGLLVVSPMAGFSEEAKLLRYPDIHRNKIVFCYGGDLYLSSVTGDNARQLTSFPGEELLPKFSPDGKQIAFTAEFEGNKDVYVMSVDGGKPRRLTYHPADEYVVDWTPDGKNVLLRSNGSSFSYRFNRLHVVPAQGGLPVVLGLSEADLASYNETGDQIAFCQANGDAFFWKGYRGGRVPNIWIYDFVHRRAELAVSDASVNRHPLWLGDSLYFVSDRGEDKIPNLFAYHTKSRTIRQITFYKEWGVAWPSKGDDRIIFENEGRLSVYDAKSGNVRSIKIEIPQAKSLGAQKKIDVRGFMAGPPALSPDGKKMIVCARGELFYLEPENNVIRNLTETSGANEKNPVWSPDGGSFAYISDVSGEEQIYIRKADGGGQPAQISHAPKSRLGKLSWSPDGRKIGYSDQRATYYVLDIRTGESQKVFFNAIVRPSETVSASWSPDSRWLAYSMANPNRSNSIFLYSLDLGTTHRVTDEFSDDSEPQFDPAGKYLYWISNCRQITIEESGIEEHGHIINPSKILVATLDKGAPAPFSEEGEMPKEQGAGNPTPIRIDVEGLGSRITALPVEDSSYSDLLALKGRLIYRSDPAKGESAIKIFDLAGKKESAVLKEVGFYSPAAQADKIAYRAGRKIGLWDVRPNQKTEDHPLDLSGLTMTVDYRKEWRQMFDEAWRIQRDLFFDENMQGMDWPAIKRKYEALIPAVAARSDLNYLIGMMLAEIGHSETMIEGGDFPEIPEVHHGLLGIDLEMDQVHRLFRIIKIYRGQNWDPERTSPLTLPGMNIQAGDYLLAIDGTPLREGVNPDALLENKAGATVILTVNGKPTWTGSRKVKVQPAAFSGEMGDFLRYNDWVLTNLERVNKASNGKIGYIPVPDTYIPGIESFLRYYMTQFDKQALIIDIRFNSGGYSPYWMLESLNREIVSYGHLPYGKAPMIDPVLGSFGPKVCLINGWASSGGDMFADTFRKLKCGWLVGQRTSGSVAAAGGVRLVDGGYVVVATKGFKNQKGENIMENMGVAPDIEVVNRPDDGKDLQLERSVEALMKQLAEREKKER